MVKGFSLSVCVVWVQSLSGTLSYKLIRQTIYVIQMPFATPTFSAYQCSLPGLQFCSHLLRRKYWNGRRKLQALVYDILPSTTATFSYAIGPIKLSTNEQFFVGAQTVVSLLQTTQIVWDVCFITVLLTPAEIKPKSFESKWNSFFYPGWMCLMFTCMLGR